jgi:hypothetical protein
MISTNRHHFFEILSEVTKELNKKIDIDDTNPQEIISSNEMDNTVKWYVIKPDDDDEDVDMTKSPVKYKKIKAASYDMDSEEDDQPWHGFSFDTTHGMLAGISWERVRDAYGNRSDKKIRKIIVVATKHENKDILLRTHLKWYDHFRISVIRLKRLVKRAKAIRIRNKALAIEHQLAHMVPDRIDNILLDKTEIK